MFWNIFNHYDQWRSIIISTAYKYIILECRSKPNAFLPFIFVFFRDRVIHLLALHSYKKPELMLRLQKGNILIQTCHFIPTFSAYTIYWTYLAKVMKYRVHTSKYRIFRYFTELLFCDNYKFYKLYVLNEIFIVGINSY